MALQQELHQGLPQSIRTLIFALLFLPTLVLARPVEVVSIYNGDSFTANVPGWPDIVGKRIGVRVKGVDTPELRGKCQAEKELARKAKQFAVTLLRDAQEVRLEEIERDKYFRLLAEVWIDGERLDQLLIGANFGYEYHGGKRRN
ncbi:thermonuclease family protein [Microbulbifer discodermiae]|uniref:thermonuclease family protein n=1 Tax=Microbulbifer sp. 2201CG32-9 TaxID=3232309 RepID=UPI00345B6C1A